MNFAILRHNFMEMIYPWNKSICVEPKTFWTQLGENIATITPDGVNNVMVCLLFTNRGKAPVR